jgi:hypothetical protein
MPPARVRADRPTIGAMSVHGMCETMNQLVESAI